MDGTSRNGRSVLKLEISHRGRRRSLGAGCAAIALAAVMSSVPAAGQDGAELVLEEIIVTAQKRQQSLQDVPVSVSVVSGETLGTQSIDDLADLSRSVPNLSVGNAALNNLVFVRGIGSGSNIGFEQSVGLFVDDVYLSRVRYMRLPFLDVERVEVLKGPQGTLFGRNTIAGAISVSSAQPTSITLAEARGEYDFELKDYAATGILSGGLSDTVRARLAVRHSGGSGFVSNSASGASGPDKDETAARLIVSADLSDALSMTAKVEHSDFDIKGSTIQIVTAGSALARFQAVDPAFETRLDKRRSVGGLTMDRDHTKTTLGTLRADYELEGATLTGIAAYAGYELERDVDTDFSPLPFLSTEVPDEKFDQFSLELRAASNGGETINWITGLYLETNEFRSLDLTDVNGPGSGSPTLAPLVASSVTRFDQDAKVASLFAQAEWRLTDELALTGGLRWNRETKDGAFDHRVTEFGRYDTPLASATGRTLMRVGLGRQDGAGAADRVETRFTPSANLTWQHDDVMLYARFAQGFKAGGFNGAQTTPVTATTPFEFDSERANSYEAGAKLSLWRRLEVNTALFRTDYENLQVSVLNGASFSVGNAAEARSQGLEVESRLQATSWLGLSTSLAWLDAKYTNYRDAPCPSRPAATPFSACRLLGTVLVQDLSGQRLIYAPEWKGRLGADIEFDLEGGMTFTSALSLDFTSSYFMVADNDPLDRQGGYAKVNLRLAVAGQDDRWEVALLGRNLTDRMTSNVGNDVPAITGAHYRSLDPPRSIMVQGRLSY